MIRLFSFLILSISFLTSVNALKSTDGYYPLGSYYLKDNQYYPIAKTSGNSPVARVGGTNIKVNSTNTRFQRLEIYGDGFINVLEVSAYGVNSDLRSVRSNQDGSKIPNRGYVDFKIQSETDLNDCYIVAFSGSADGYSGINKDEFYVNFKEIGSLKAGQIKEASVATLFPNSIDADREIRYCLAFYSAGTPIQSNFDDLLATHFLSKKRQEYSFYMKQYVENNQGKTLKP